MAELCSVPTGECNCMMSFRGELVSTADKFGVDADRLIKMYDIEKKEFDDIYHSLNDENMRQRDLTQAYRTVLADMMRYGTRWEY